DVANAEPHIPWQLLLHAGVVLDHVRAMKIVVDELRRDRARSVEDRLTQRKHERRVRRDRRQRLRRDIGQTRKWRTPDHVLLQGGADIPDVVVDSETGANGRLSVSKEVIGNADAGAEVLL